MTHPPTAPPASPPGGQGAAARAPWPATAAPPAAPPTPEPPRRSAFAEGAAQVRAAARTEPGRLRIIGAAVAGLLLLFGALTFFEITDRADAARTVEERSQPLSADAAEIYRSLADANTTAAAGFLAGADEDPAVRERYERDIDNAARLLASAAAHSSDSASARRYIETLTEELPFYAGLVETARANNRQGLPLGGAYLRYADQRMQDTLLTAAEELYELETRRFEGDLADARDWPWLALGSGALALAALAWAQRRHYLRTNRVFNPGLVAATTAAAVLLIWLAGAHVVARGALSDADENAAQSLSALNGAWTEALKARGDESMTLVTRGAGSEFEDSYTTHMDALAAERGGLLPRAGELAEDAEGRAPVDAAVAATEEWQERHSVARELETAGAYDEAVEAVIGVERPEESTGESFDRVDASLADAVEHEQREFTRAAADGHGALGGLTAGAVLLALLAALGTVLGIARRLSEYR
ncbi:hypothetical protein [Streptomyces sp. PT12]|uniref:hypothetical protein n=1 Tax=Streptomyces sp. PT12 TaxID=1510197 RepID=UPI000DE323C1|nr:hypothetical protein [Streptomyces sp. PT12]RBM18066.1 hypothetical protein DEH69_13580 [Streptomyces sp. PT12]